MVSDVRNGNGSFGGSALEGQLPGGERLRRAGHRYTYLNSYSFTKPRKPLGSTT